MTRTQRHLQLIAVLLGLFVFVTGALPLGVAAKPVKDVQPTQTKVLSFEDSCKSLGGKANTRPSAMDADKSLASCSGGTLDGLTCIYTPTTSDCWTEPRPK